MTETGLLATNISMEYRMRDVNYPVGFPDTIEVIVSGTITDTVGGQKNVKSKVNFYYSDGRPQKADPESLVEINCYPIEYPGVSQNRVVQCAVNHLKATGFRGELPDSEEEIGQYLPNSGFNSE